MTATETYNLLTTDIDKTLTAILGVRTIDGIHFERTRPGYVYEQDKSMHEYWIALGQYSFSGNLSTLAFVINGGSEQLLSTRLNSRQDLIDYYKFFKSNKDKVIASFDAIIGKPNIVFIGYAVPITMEQYLGQLVSYIHDEALNLEYNYNQIKKLSRKQPSLN
jgi:hypothetical protein